ncbi:MAG: hypothetical protein HYV77_04530 [Candidatus Wildermuthbacteria bacterium]|nr:hypothetical protein [Candidatus Wildermuthbacteria bacterium]
MNPKRLLLIDANSLIHRAFHAIPPLHTSRGEAVNAVYGFLQILLRVLQEFHPDYAAAAFDVEGPTFRHKKFDRYKGKRQKAPDELYAQFAPIKTLLKILGIPTYELQGYEADDIIATLAVSARDKKDANEVIIVSGDMDVLQIVDDRVKVYTMKKGIGETVLYNRPSVEKRFGGLRPDQLADYKGLRGDVSDNIPGVRGIGEKTAIQLLLKFGSVESLYEALEKGKDEAKEITPRLQKLLADEKEKAFMSKMLGMLDRAVPIENSLQNFSEENLKREDFRKMLSDLEFQGLIKRLFPGNNQESLFGEKNPEPNIFEKIEQLKKIGVLSQDLCEMERHLAPVIDQMEKAGIQINKEYFFRLSSEISKELEELRKHIFKEAGREFNVNSPQQLSGILFEDLRISIKGLKKTPGRVVSTAASELEKLRGEHPIVDFLLKYRELQKLFTTYINTLPELTDSQGRIHTHFDQLGTATGRISSSNPNLQNIPLKGDWGTRIRKGFVAAEGFQFAGFDYSQMELRVAAHVADDKKMQEFFLENKDIHRMTAAEVFGIPPEKVTDEMRYRAKALNFGVLYGMGASGFARSAGIPMEEAQEFIDNYFTRFPQIMAYIEKTKQFGREHGYTETMFGRKRYIPEINSTNFQIRSAAEREAVNHPIQGGAADLMKMAMVRVAEQVLPSYPNARMLIQIHDELLFEIKEDILNKIIPEIKTAMEGVCAMKIPLVVGVEHGKDWGSMR